MSFVNKWSNYKVLFSPLAVTFLICIFYLALSIIFFGPWRSWFAFYLGQGPDPMTFAWFCNWWPFSILHGLNPFHTDYVWYPDGYNMAWATSVPTLSLFMSPLTQAFGPLFSYNLLSILAPAASASTAYLLANEIVKKSYISCICGFLFGFSSCETAHLLGDLNLATTFLVPIAVLLCIRRLRKKIRRPVFILAIAFTASAQLGISTELLADCCIFGVLCWLLFWVSSPGCERVSHYALAKDLALSAPISLALSFPFLYFFFSGGNQFPGSFFSSQFYEADLANFVIPTSITFFGHVFFSQLSNSFTGNLLEQGAYLGIPIIIITCSFFIFDARTSKDRVLLWCTILFAILSLGPTLEVAGDRTNIMLPWRLIQSIPLICMALPARICMFTSLCTSLIVAIWVSKGRSNHSTAFRYCFALIACVTIIPNRASHQLTKWPQDSFFSPYHIHQALGQQPNVIILPFFDAGPGMAWQLNAGMQFKQATAYVGYPPRQEESLLLFRELLDGTPTNSFENDLSIFCLINKVNYILIGPNTAIALVNAIHRLKWAQHLDGDVTVVQVPPLKNLTYGYIEGNYWPTLAPLNFAGKKFNVITNGAPYLLTISGQDRPSNIITHFTIKNQFGTKTYVVDNKTILNIPLSHYGVTTVLADSTFVPDQFFHNGDERNLSAMVSLNRVWKGP